jgi:hypothetical protein
MFAACAWAQLKFDVHPVTGRASDRLKETQRVLRVAQQSAWRDARAPEEVAVVDVLAKTYRTNFLPELLPEPRIATLTEKGVDILAAKWDGAGPYSELIVWDTPESWSSDSAIRAKFEALLPTPGTDGSRPKGATLNIARDAQTQRWIGTGGLLIAYPPRQFDLGQMNWIDLWETAGSSYLSATFSMYATGQYPHNMRLIPERFPPLESRVTQWSKKRILDELSREPEPPGHPRATVFTWERDDMRDRVLARELLKRVPTDEELLAALRRRTIDNGAVLQAVVDAKQVVRYSNVIREYLPTDWRMDRMLGAHAFDIVRKVPDVDFTDVALAVLRQNSGEAAARRYAVAHGANVSTVP